MFKQPKCHIKMVLLMLLLLTEASNDEKTNTSVDTYLSLFMKIWTCTSKHIIINTAGEEETAKFQMGRGHWSVISAIIEVNFDELGT